MHHGHAQGFVVLIFCVLISHKIWGKGESSIWFLDRIIFFCKMDLAVVGREMELFSFLASLEANKMKWDYLFESVGDELVGGMLFSDGAN